MGAVVEGLITGIDFIGGGAILKLNSSVKRIATAASLWGAGVIGAAVGLGASEGAIVIACLIKVTLFVLPRFKLANCVEAAPENEASDKPEEERQG